MDLFSEQKNRAPSDADPTKTPLPARMRPVRIEEIVGQKHILGENRLLRRAIEADRLASIILYGPPGCGKTTLAEVIAETTERRFERISAVMANVSVLRDILKMAKEMQRLRHQETILFIDEIHRFNKSQQDVLLPYVENGDIILIGATTHNPYFFINSPLVSRSQVFQLEPLDAESVEILVRRALESPRGLTGVAITGEAVDFLAGICDGDARRALNALELAAETTPLAKDGWRHISKAEIEDSIQQKALVYDNGEDEHYNTISAFIKSVRGSDPDAATYWLAKMLLAGEDPRFIARRLIILASEDVGNADPHALLVASAAMRSVEFVGMPEARIVLSQATNYLASAPKSNSSCCAIDAAMQDIKNGRSLAVPKHLRDAHYKGSETLGHKGYKYAHDYKGHFVDQEYLPSGKRYYKPSNQGYEAIISERLKNWRKRGSKSRPKKEK